MIKVLLADDQQLIRVGFRMILEAEPDIRIVGEAADGFEAVALARRVQPDVTLMDVRMPGLDGVEATRRITANTSTKVLILTTFDIDDYAFNGLRNGASGFLLKDVPPEGLLAAIRAVSRGDAVLTPRITRHFVDRYGRNAATPPSPLSEPREVAHLTQREREVFNLVAEGLSNGEIAARLVVSEATVKTHITRVLAKLGLRDRVQAVIYAYQNHLHQGFEGRDKTLG